MTYRRK